MNTSELPPVPMGLPALLRACASDLLLLECVVEGRAAAAQKAGFPLTPSEAAVLQAANADQLREMAAACRSTSVSSPTLQNLSRVHGIRPPHVDRQLRGAPVRGITPGGPFGGGRGLLVPLFALFAAGVAVLYYLLRGR